MRQGFFVLVLVAALLGWGIESAIVWPGFQPKAVLVNGARVVPAQEVRRAAGIRLDENIWLLNPWAIAGRIEAIPYVDKASLRRTLPNHVAIVISERRPDTCIQSMNGEVLTIDAVNRVLEYGCKTPVIFTLPRLRQTHLGAVIDDPLLMRFRTITATFSSEGLHVRRIALDRDGGAIVQSTDKLTFLLGDDTDLAPKVRLITPIIQAARGHGEGLEEIDLRALETPVARYRETPRGAQNRAAKL